MHRFFVEPDPTLGLGAEITLPAEVTRQVGYVLRLRPGDTITLLDGSGDECLVELGHFGREAIIGRVVARRPVPGEAGRQVTLYQCVLKGEKFGWVLQKATELGVAALVPVVSTRTIPPLSEVAQPAKAERWTRIVREAAEQSGRGRLPRLHPPLLWNAAITQATAAGLTLLPWEGLAATGARDAPWARARAVAQCSLVIGPEGGLAAAEVEAAVAAGAIAASLGPRILRAETAALAALALLLLPD